MLLYPIHLENYSMIQKYVNKYTLGNQLSHNLSLDQAHVVKYLFYDRNRLNLAAYELALSLSKFARRRDAKAQRRKKSGKKPRIWWTALCWCAGRKSWKVRKRRSASGATSCRIARQDAKLSDWRFGILAFSRFLGVLNSFFTVNITGFAS